MTLAVGPTLATDTELRRYDAHSELRPDTPQKDFAMPNRDDIRWFKQHFAARIAPALAGTPLTTDLLVAIACQETGFIWSTLRRKGTPIPQILALCVGDVIDSKPDGTGRRAFPKNRAALMAHPRGDAMFAIARQALLDMAKHIAGYKQSAVNPDTFCRGYGLFQRDLQFFQNDPDYFLEQRYTHFDDTLAMCLAELAHGVRKLGVPQHTQLDDEALAQVAIVYNTGRFLPGKGLRQGFFDNEKFYGERVFEYLRLSKTVGVGGLPPAIPAPNSGEAALPPPTAMTASGPFFRVDTRISTLRLRSAPQISQPATANVIADLPDGHPVRAITGLAMNGFMEIETSLMGARLHGFSSTDFLTREDRIDSIPIVTASPQPPTQGFVAAHICAPTGMVVRRSGIAGAHSLNEQERPTRIGTDAATRCQELAAIIDWLACDAPAHLRYKPRDGLTFCNIYAHDYSDLAGVYLPRVWWTQGAVARIALGEDVPARIGNTVREMRADDLFFWLRDFGPHFGWRQTGTTSKLQREVNMGAVGLIIAEREQDGLPGHVAMVVPETAKHLARRDAAGEVTAPLQSQAGKANMRYSTGKANWWKDEKFSAAAFWLHA